MKIAGNRRTALVTGADVNLGRTMALALLQAGCNVALTSLSEDGLRAAIDEAGPAAERAINVVADLSQPGECDRIIATVNAAFGAVDMIVNNAALTPETLWPDWLEAGEPEPWKLGADLYRKFLEVDAVAPHSLIATALPEMLRRRWGRIVNVTTSLDTMLRFWPYGSAKAALEAETAVLAKRLAGTGVTANVLVPGGFTKPGPLNLPSGRIIEPQLRPTIMAGPIRWLASEESAAFTARRVLAARWSTSLPPAEAALAASFEVGWSVESQQAIEPAITGARR